MSISSKQALESKLADFSVLAEDHCKLSSATLNV